jgi:hypothetical protein
MMVCRMSVVSAEHLGIAEKIYAAVVADTSKVYQSHDHGHLAIFLATFLSHLQQRQSRCTFECTEGCVKAVPRD